MFDILTIEWGILGIILILLGVKNYKTGKKKFDVSYFQIGLGVVFLLYAFLRLFVGTSYWNAGLGVSILIITEIIIYLKKRHCT